MAGAGGSEIPDIGAVIEYTIAAIVIGLIVWLAYGR